MRLLDIRDISIEDIESNPNQPREIFDEVVIRGMAKSIKKIGLTNPITVRKINEKYQIIAGELRYQASKLLDKKEIQARIIDANDIETDIISLTENYHRKDLDSKEREKSIYTSWKRGKAEGVYNTIVDMYEATGIPESTLQENIAGGKEREDKNNIDIKEIQEATAKELEKTRTLKKIAPKTRKEILHQSAIEKKLNARDIEHIVRAVKIISDTKTSPPDDVLKEIPKLVADKKLKPTQTEDFLKAVADAPKDLQEKVIKEISQNEKIDPEKTKKYTEVLKESPPDIQKKLLEKEISIDEAEKVNILFTEEQRNQLLAERRKMKKDMQNDIERHTKTRMRQALELKQGKDTSRYTEIDYKKIEEINSNIPEEQDKRILEEIRKYRMNFTIKADHIKNLNLDSSKKEAIEHIWKIYERCYDILVELGEIKVIGIVDVRKSPVPPKLYGIK